jgi:hypothetical protein
MVHMSFQDEELGYISSSPLVATQKTEATPQDERDLSTLKKVQGMLAKEIEARKTTDRLTLDETIFTVKEQVALNKEIAIILGEIKLTVDTAINNVKEKYE